jgi:Tol biopolymer transport system component
MTTERRLARDLPNILGDLATGPYPEYIDDVLAITSHVRQRPAWTFPERWLPMLDIAREPVIAPRLPWRAISVAVLLIALLLAAVAVLIGSQPRLAPPYGLARNGLVAYEAAGDIYTADPVTGVATAIVTGPENDVAPRFSNDGASVVFQRTLDGGMGQLYVARSDGTQLRLITPEPVALPDAQASTNYEFSPDGRSVLFMSAIVGGPSILIARTDGSGVRRLDLGGLMAERGTFRPPDGTEILFVDGSGVYAVNLASGVVRPIVKPATGTSLTGATWSPDGSRILYWSWDTNGDGMTARTHVISADGTGDLVLPAPPDAVWNAVAAWSNDGSRIFLVRGYTPDFADVRPAVLPADGSSAGIEIPVGGTAERDCCSAWTWSPDDSKIIGRPGGTTGTPLQQLILDPVAGTSRSAPWTSTSDPTWQRLAP